MIEQNFLITFFPIFLKGLFVTLQIAFFSCVLGLIGGTITGIVLTKKIKILRQIFSLYVIVIRGTPMLFQVAAVYYILNFSGLAISPYWSAIFSIGLNSSAYLSQVIVSGINAVKVGQIEAAKTVGFNNYQIMIYIVLPQALQVVLPALGNEFVTLVKDSSLAATIGVYELTKQGEIAMSQTYDAPAVYLVIGLMYLLITTIVSFFVSLGEKRMQYHVKH